MQGSSVHGATRNRLSEPEDDWLGEVSDYDWSENAAAHAEAGRVRASPESDVAATAELVELSGRLSRAADFFPVRTPCLR